MSNTSTEKPSSQNGLLTSAGSAVRSAFEDWSEAEHYPLELSYRFSRHEDGDYKLSETQLEWEAFKAGYLHSQNK